MQPTFLLLRILRTRFHTWLNESAPWKAIMYLAAVGNVVAEWPQAWEVWHTRALSAVSPTMFWTFLSIQVVFSINAWAKGDPFILYSGGGAAIASSTILLRLYGVRWGWF